MAEQVGTVTRVDRIRESKEKGKSGEGSPRRGGSVHREKTGDDSVEISEEARERALGRRRRTILEYLEDEKV